MYTVRQLAIRATSSAVEALADVASSPGSADADRLEAVRVLRGAGWLLSRDDLALLVAAEAAVVVVEPAEEEEEKKVDPWCPEHGDLPIREGGAGCSCPRASA
jgi:hypothetical protein